MLKSWGHDVIVACDGEQAWDCLQAESAPKLVLLDWMMAGVDGIELCRRVRRSDCSGVYIVMLTAKTEPADLLMAIESGVDDFVTKPLKSADLRARLRTACHIVELQQAWDDSSQDTESLVYAEWG